MKLLQNLHNYDLSTFDWCLRRQHRQLLISTSRYISTTADGPLYVVGALLALALQYFEFVTLLVIALLIERSLYFVLKKHFRRNRPPQAIPGFQSIVEPGDQFSFPSGHTSAAFLCATMVSAVIPALAWALYPWAVTVGMSRVLLGVHFPTDTVAGAILGYSIATLILMSGGVV